MSLFANHFVNKVIVFFKMFAMTVKNLIYIWVGVRDIITKEANKELTQKYPSLAYVDAAIGF